MSISSSNPSKSFKDKSIEFIKEWVWPILKAVPKILFKTKPGILLLAGIFTPILQTLIPDITFDQVSNIVKALGVMDFSGDGIANVLSILLGVLATIFASKQKTGLKQIVEDKRGTKDRVKENSDRIFS